MRQIVVLLSLAILLSPVAAEPTPPEVPNAPTTTDAAELADAATPAVKADPLGDLLEGVADAGDAVGGFFGDVGDALSSAMSAIGRLIGDALDATGRAAVALGTGIAALGTGLSALAAGSINAVGRAAFTVAQGVGIVVPGIAVAVFVGIGDGLAAIARGIGRAFNALFDFYFAAIQPLRPEAMNPSLFNAAAAGGATASAGVGGWALLDRLRRYGALLGLAGFSRLREDQLLEHPLRNAIFTAIQQKPGIHASALAREVGSGWGTIVHHLQKLEKARLVTTRMVNNQKCFFEQGGDVSRDDMEVASALKGDTAQSIAFFVANNPMTSQKDVAEAVGISAALASFHVKKLVAQGALDRVRRGKAWLLTTSDGFRRVNTKGMLPPAVSAGVRVAA